MNGPGQTIPQQALNNTLRTYGELHKKFDLFLKGETESAMLIISRPGLGKSHYLKKQMDKDITHYMHGNLRPLRSYIDLYAHKDKLIILDDAETLWETKPGRILMRELTDTRFPKSISWTSTIKQLADEGVPTRYDTNSKSLVICNAFGFGNTYETKAILDRCVSFYFVPSNAEVARYSQFWFWDQKVLDFVCANLHLINDLSARQMVKAAERRRHGDHKWKNEFSRHRGERRIVQEICCDPGFLSSKAQVDEFIRRTAVELESKMSRATFFRIKNELKKKGQLLPTEEPLRLKARGKPPSASPQGVDAIRRLVQSK